MKESKHKGIKFITQLISDVWRNLILATPVLAVPAPGAKRLPTAKPFATVSPASSPNPIPSPAADPNARSTPTVSTDTFASKTNASRSRILATPTPAE